MSGILRLESLTKGNTLKQGDKTPLKYRLFDADGEKLNIAGKSASVRLVYPDFLTIGYEKEGLTVAQDDTVTFTIDKVIPAKLYHVEIIVDNKFIFPSRADESKFTVDKSSLGTESSIIEIVGVDAVVRKAVDLINKDPNLIIDEDKLVTDIISNTGIGSIEEYHQQFNDVIKELSEEKDYHSLPEIAGARRGYSTLAESLQNLSASMLNPNLGKLTQKHMSDELLAQIAGDAAVNAVPADGSLTTEKFADKSVTSDKTSFIDVSTNLFDKSKIIKGYAINATTGEQYPLDGYVSTDFIELKELTSYTILEFNRIIYYGADKNYLGAHQFTETPTTRISPTHTRYARLSVQGESRIDSAILNEGTSLLPYEPYYKRLSEDIETAPIADKSITAEKIADEVYQTSNNFYDKRTEVVGYALLSTTGELVPNADYHSTPFYSVTPNEVWSSMVLNRVHFYDINKTQVFYKSISRLGDTFTIPKNAYFMRLHRRVGEGEYPQISKGGTLPPYEPHYVTVGGYKIGQDIMPKEDEVIKKSYRFVPDEIGSGLVLEDDNFIKPTVSELYNMYDGLISNNPEYFTKKNLGKDTTGNYDIYEYHLKPVEYDGSKTFGGSNKLVNKLPKISFIANIHGHEQSSALAAYYMTKAICEDWKMNPILEYLRFNVEFKFIPIVYPHGYDTDTYKNVTGINLQTNFPYKFIVRPEDSNVYGGTEPLTEIETIYCKNFIDENLDSALFIDVHAPDYQEDFSESVDSLFYYLIEKGEHYLEDIDISVKYSIESNTRLLKKNYPITRDKFLGWVQMRDGEGTADAYANSVGIPSVVMELPQRMPYSTERHSSDTIKAATEVFINSILTILRRFKEVY